MPRRTHPPRRRVHPARLPKGAGRVNCLDCGATVAADGKGTPMVLRHMPGCPQDRRRK